MERLAHFRILGRIGAGGMGEVYRARDEKLQRDVAIKVLPAESFADDAARARLMREARSAAALNHPNICVVHEVGEVDGQAFIAMECVEGTPLDARLSAGPLSPSDVIRYGIQLADALAHAHQRDIVHRDLKPGNVIIGRDGRLKVLDFGLAKRIDHERNRDVTTTPNVLLTEPGTVLGTPAYMAPEQLRGQPADARTDLWAFGVILHEMASGRRPFDGQTWPELSAAILMSAPIPLPPELPAELRLIIGRCLEKDPGRRYQRAEEVRAALEMVHDSSSARHVAPRERMRRWPLLAAAASMATIILIALVLRDRFALPMTGGTRIDSIGVLPLTNLTGDAEQDYLVDGIHSGIIGELAQFPAIRVISRTSMLRFRGGGKSLPEIAKEIDVRGIVEGSVTRSGNRIRLHLVLVEGGGKERPVWASAFERDARDVLALQREAVVSMLRGAGVKLTAAEEARAANARAVDEEAHRLYLQGMFHLGAQKRESIRKAIDLLRQANEKDPTDPLPYAGLAQAYSMIGHDEDPQAFLRARAAAMKALELDDTIVQAHEVLAEIRLYREWDYEAAAQSFRRVIELSPNLAAAHAHYAWCELLYRRDAVAIAEMKRAAELDPLTPLYSAWLGWIYGATGDSERALVEVRRSLELQPDFPTGLRYLGIIYREKKMFAEAIEAHQKLAALNPKEPKGALAVTYAAAGRSEEARAILAKLEREERPKYLGLAFVYAELGMESDALRALQRAFEARESLLPWVELYRGFDRLRNHPEYRDLVRRLRLPPERAGT